MNMILGKLILHLQEEEAFWVFTMLLERVLPIDYYSQMMGVNSDCQFLGDQLLRETMPDIFERFEELNFKTTFFSFNWFVCLFQDKLSDRLSLAILDLIFIHGSHILISVALTIVYMLKSRIMQAEDF
jgi:Rab-GTPase-TBC domain